jgi:hypothetical protein
MLSGDILNAVEHIINATSADISSGNQATRTKIKYTSSAKKVGNILFSLGDRFRVLEVGGIRMCSYRTFYFDTRDCLFYNEYVKKAPIRHKIRIRHYSNLNKYYFEIKVKNFSTGEQVKHRLEIESFDKYITPETEELLNKLVGISFDKLVPTLESSFKRLILVDHKSNQRISIDMDPIFKNPRTNLEIGVPELVIIETQQDDNSIDYFQIAVNPDDIKLSNFSRYMTGMFLTNANR